MKSVLVAVAALAALSLPAHAAGFDDIVLSATKDGGTPQSSFPVDTPVIYVSADLVDIAPTSKITFSWVSVDSHGAAPENYTIDKVDLDVGANNEADSQLTKPTAGWPEGTYRVDLAIDGTVAESVPFSIP
ncbi:hypothetical protein FJ492_06420 [Mesorhizobium sp. B2-5-4]|uniref:hypothetical protein n=1 Tax=Mesorhizobium sp. B2-5-4 TaxID=2589926 RepID=UPI00112B88EE|nr:hypothetical protein [Mesorhizobium sp. B2-5-4]TPK46794.1 hypothetical protein FJ492_06420 [Mesorhizobium sp. B2-5-4]